MAMSLVCMLFLSLIMTVVGSVAAAAAGPSTYSSTIPDPSSTPFWSSSRNRWVQDKVVAKSQITVMGDGQVIGGINSHNHGSYDDQPIVIDMVLMVVSPVRPRGDRRIVASDVLRAGRVEQFHSHMEVCMIGYDILGVLVLTPNLLTTYSLFYFPYVEFS